MTYIKYAVAVIALVFLQACENPETYPVSGEDCGPNDPVLDLNAEDCTVPGV
ncbi:hypothetical protein ACERZ8_14295 [Tateyamaria armeniaca]|uniref:Uncharacterized protein n=1 Tax=Tateyamaria armeniaca TaxID=2518930 RepID=A0ABW8UV17_9RHOB